jgi:hypothetical protein
VLAEQESGARNRQRAKCRRLGASDAGGGHDVSGKNETPALGAVDRCETPQPGRVLAEWPRGSDRGLDDAFASVFGIYG